MENKEVKPGLLNYLNSMSDKECTYKDGFDIKEFENFIEFFHKNSVNTDFEDSNIENLLKI